MFTLIKFSGKVWYDVACITVGSVVMWHKELKDLHGRGWFDPQAVFDAADMEEMDQ